VIFVALVTLESIAVFASRYADLFVPAVGARKAAAQPALKAALLHHIEAIRFILVAPKLAY
jgi:hypothetical protein